LPDLHLDLFPSQEEMSARSDRNWQLVKGLGLELVYGAQDLIGRVLGDTPLSGPTQAEQEARNPAFWTHPAARFLSTDGINILAIIVGGRVAGGEAVGGVEAPSVSGARGPSFVVTPKGDVIPVPTGASGPVPVINPGGRTTGFA